MGTRLVLLVVSPGSLAGTFGLVWRRWLLSALLASGVLVAATQAAPPATGLPRAEPGEVGMDAATLAQIAPRMKRFVDQQQIAGAVTLVARRGKVVHLEAVGHAHLQQQRPMRPNSVFAIASMTKPITATAVMILQDEGRLSIDDPVEKHLPEFKRAALAQGRLERPLTIRHMLTHTSGLGGDQQNLGALRETARRLAERPLSFQPGDKWQYGPGLTVCGAIVEEVSGQPFEEFLAERIFKPLGMVDTTFHPTAEQQGRMAQLYQASAEGSALEPATHWIVEISPRRSPNPSGGLFSTAPDMARFYQVILAGGELDGRRIVSREAVRQMTQLQTGELITGFTPGNGWGLGWCVVRQPQGVSGMLSPGAFGHGGAFGTQGWVDPQRELILVLLIQRLGLPNSDASEMRAAFQELAVRAIHP